MQGCRYEDDASAGGGICSSIRIGLSGFDQVRNGGSKGVIGAQHVDVND